ncbi:MAG TPA: pyruvate, phosphate dikinase, partial [Anaerolineales bacterium]|nr:pyruvate, phosphate dikinase [Anaerolineales bacterium]
ISADFEPEATETGDLLIRRPDGSIAQWMPAGTYHFLPKDAPLADAALEDLETFEPRRITDEELDFLHRAARRLHEETDYAVFAWFGGSLIEGAQFARGWVQFMRDLKANPDFAAALVEKLAQAALADLDRFLDAVGEYVHVVGFGDDLGMQHGLQFHPDLYRRLFKPYHRQLYGRVHERTQAYVFLHTCGSVYDLIPDLIEAGVDILNPVQTSAAKMEPERLKREFGDPDNPLLVSCRSGAKFSMPGMMDTVLNIGLNDEVAKGMVSLTGDERFVYDAYRRLVQMFGTVVLDIDDEAFEHPLDAYKDEKGYKLDTEMTAADWQAITDIFKKVIKEHKGFDFPQDPYEQLKLATEAVFRSWNGKRAIDYRNAAGISHDLGTAVNIVTMVFGNMGNSSGTGVAFTRDPATGENVIYGDYLMNAQGEDVVAGIRNTKKITELAEEMPDAYKEFLDICAKLEKHYRDMQDVEFTIERGKLWMLQTRTGKRTAKAAVQIAVDMVKEGLITKEEAIQRIEPEHVDTLLHPQFKPEAKQAAIENHTFLVKGVNASPGAAVGRAYFDANTAEQKAKEEGQDVIMIRPFTKPDDVHGMLAAKGILTTEGGATSHAAVVARQFGIPCVVGASDARINLENRTLTVGDLVLKEGDWVSVDGTTGEAFLGEIDSVSPSLEEQTELLELLTWADEVSAQPGLRDFPDQWPTRGLQVWANADYPEDARRARSYGAQGIGLCRTEHMFFEPERLPIVQRMILAETSAERTAALDELLPYQRADFDGLFEAMTGLPVIIRLIDPPLHEFMPDEQTLLEEVIENRIKNAVDEDKEQLLASIEAMHESNPMMGLRGVRLSVVMPEIVEMQVRAIFEAAADVKLRGLEPKPEVMIPLTGTVKELEWVQPRLERIAKTVMEEKNVEFEYKFGTMIEIPRAGLTADQVAG